MVSRTSVSPEVEFPSMPLASAFDHSALQRCQRRCRLVMTAGLDQALDLFKYRRVGQLCRALNCDGDDKAIAWAKAAIDRTESNCARSL